VSNQAGAVLMAEDNQQKRRDGGRSLYHYNQRHVFPLRYSIIVVWNNFVAFHRSRNPNELGDESSTDRREETQTHAV